MKLDGNKLIDARHKKGMTQAEVSRRSGVNVTTIVRAEQGQDIHPPTGKKLAEAIGVELDTLFPSDAVERTA